MIEPGIKEKERCYSKKLEKKLLLLLLQSLFYFVFVFLLVLREEGAYYGT